jgi:hypothetical protein
MPIIGIWCCTLILYLGGFIFDRSIPKKKYYVPSHNQPLDIIMLLYYGTARSKAGTGRVGYGLGRTDLDRADLYYGPVAFACSRPVKSNGYCGDDNHKTLNGTRAMD